MLWFFESDCYSRTISNIQNNQEHQLDGLNYQIDQSKLLIEQLCWEDVERGAPWCFCHRACTPVLGGHRRILSYNLPAIRREGVGDAAANWSIRRKKAMPSLGSNWSSSTSSRPLPVQFLIKLFGWNIPASHLHQAVTSVATILSLVSGRRV